MSLLLAEFNVTVKLFADDVKLYAEVFTDVDAEHFSHALSFISEWANTWQSVAYYSKTLDMQVALLHICSTTCT